MADISFYGLFRKRSAVSNKLSAKSIIQTDNNEVWSFVVLLFALFAEI